MTSLALFSCGLLQLCYRRSFLLQDRPDLEGFRHGSSLLTLSVILVVHERILIRFKSAPGAHDCYFIANDQFPHGLSL